jgi:hypothetical protein
MQITGTPSYTVLSVDLGEADEDGVIDLTQNNLGFGPLHIRHAGTCLDIEAERLWPWVAGLVGMTVVDENSAYRATLFLDCDTAPPEAQTVIGLFVRGQKGGHVRQVVLSLDDFWAELLKLAGEGPHEGHPKGTRPSWDPETPMSMTSDAGSPDPVKANFDLLIEDDRRWQSRPHPET